MMMLMSDDENHNDCGGVDDADMFFLFDGVVLSFSNVIPTPSSP